ncbi:MAG TPA: heme-binding protein [Dermatophilaceae bacterium]|nr:heme-binding protein [Dermatophilaceae bacterium]
MTEQQPYDVVAEHEGFELRRYPASVVAEVVVDAPFGDAGNRAFRTLLGYLTGRNRSRQGIAMTAPVLQAPATGAPQKVAMTAPVLQQPDADGRHVVAFVLPAAMTLDAAPEPTDPGVTLREVPEHLAAASRYSGRWSETAYREHEAALLDAVHAAGLTPVGAPRFARFDPPMKPWFLRRNEVVVEVGGPPAS